MLGRKRMQQTDARPRQRAEIKSTPRQTFSSYYNRPRQPSDSPAAPSKPVSASRRLRLVPSAVALLVITGSLLFSMTLSARPSVSMLHGQKSPYHPVEAYADEAARLMDAELANRTKLTIDTGAVERQLLERFPELRAAVLRLPILGRRPTLILDMKSPALVLVSSARSIVLDEGGVAICELKDLDEKARAGLKIVEDQSGLELRLGQQALPSGSIGFISEVAAYLAQAEVDVNRMVLPPSPTQLDIYPAGLPYFIKTDMAGDPRLQAGSFLAVRDNLAEQGVVPQEYIDVRVEERAFYR